MLVKEATCIFRWQWSCASEAILGPDSIKRCHLTSIGNPIVEIRRSYDRLISTMEFPIPVRRHLYIESGPWKLCVNTWILYSEENNVVTTNKAYHIILYIYRNGSYSFTGCWVSKTDIIVCIYKTSHLHLFDSNTPTHQLSINNVKMLCHIWSVDIFSSDDMQYSNMVLTHAINWTYFDPHPRRHIALS